MKILFACLLSCLAFGALGAQSPAELLAQIDERRTIPDMSFDLRITSFESGKQKDYNVLWGNVKDTGAASSVLVYFAEPASVKGRKMLMAGRVVYYLFPRTRNPIRLSPLQVLLGETSNGDVASTGFARDYDVTAFSETVREGAACYLFKLDAKEESKDSSYAKVELWVEKASLRPLYAEFGAADGKLLKKAAYGDYRTAEGKDLPFTLDITDGDDPQKHTTMVYSRIGRKSVPETAFRRDYLDAWNPEPSR